MENYFDTLKRLIEQLLIGNTAFDEIEVAADLFDVFAVSGREVVKDAHTRAGGKQCRSDMRADESGSARYQCCS